MSFADMMFDQLMPYRRTRKTMHCGQHDQTAASTAQHVNSARPRVCSSHALL